MAAQDRFSLRNIYLYLVCLITLIMTIFALVSVVRNTVELLYPDPGAQVFAPKEAGVSPEEMARQEESMRESTRRWAVINLVGSGTMLVIAVPVYAYHWRRIQKELPAATVRQAAAGPPAG